MYNKHNKQQKHGDKCSQCRRHIKTNEFGVCRDCKRFHDDIFKYGKARNERSSTKIWGVYK